MIKIMLRVQFKFKSHLRDRALSGQDKSGVVMHGSRKHLLVVNRSPHGNKKHRDQFVSVVKSYSKDRCRRSKFSDAFRHVGPVSGSHAGSLTVTWVKGKSV